METRSPKGISGSWIPRASLAQGNTPAFPSALFLLSLFYPVFPFFWRSSWGILVSEWQGDIFVSGLPCLTTHKMESPRSHLYHFVCYWLNFETSPFLLPHRADGNSHTDLSEGSSLLGYNLSTTLPCQHQKTIDNMHYNFITHLVFSSVNCETEMSVVFTI